MDTADLPRGVYDVYGEAKTNADGTDRQDIFLHVNPGDPLTLADAGETVDILTKEGHAIGRITWDDEAEVSARLAAGERHSVRVYEVRGGDVDRGYYGVYISIAWGSERHPAPIPMTAAQLRSRRSRIGHHRRRQGLDPLHPRRPRKAEIDELFNSAEVRAKLEEWEREGRRGMFDTAPDGQSARSAPSPPRRAEHATSTATPSETPTPAASGTSWVVWLMILMVALLIAVPFIP